MFLLRENCVFTINANFHRANAANPLDLWGSSFSGKPISGS